MRPPKKMTHIRTCAHAPMCPYTHAYAHTQELTCANANVCLHRLWVRPIVHHELGWPWRRALSACCGGTVTKARACVCMPVNIYGSLCRAPCALCFPRFPPFICPFIFFFFELFFWVLSGQSCCALFPPIISPLIFKKILFN